MKKPTAVRVNILGIDYAVTGYEDPDYLREVAGFVDERMRVISRMQREIPPHKNAILTALNLADELLRTRQEFTRFQEDAANFSRRISDRTRRLSELCSRIEN